MAGRRVRKGLCVCDGRYEGCEHGWPCKKKVTNPSWGPWCAACNPRRIAHVDASLRNIFNSFGK